MSDSGSDPLNCTSWSRWLVAEVNTYWSESDEYTYVAMIEPRTARSQESHGEPRPMRG